MKPLCVGKQAFLISQTIRKSKLIEIITSVVHVSSFDETHSSTGSKRNTLSKLATSNPCVHWTATTKLKLYQTVYHKKKLDYYQGHSSVSNDKS
jgi:hypothetical protein